MAKPALGRGLGALLGGAPAAAKPPQPAAPASTPAAVPAPEIDARERVQRVALDRVRPCPFQPRKEFTAEALRELADSIREQGIVQPLIVRERNGHFELIAGERRWRAAQIVNLSEVPVIVREADDRAVLELALIENLQRENLNAIEEAQGYSQLIGQFQLTQEEVATKVGKSRAVVANELRLLKLPLTLQGYIRDGRLSVGHAKVVLGLGFIIFIHELGHFLAAKWCDVHVRTFSIGFGPAVPFCSYKWGETTYMVGVIPLGGYVEMVGQTDGPESENDADHDDDPRSFRRKTVGQRMLIISAGVILWFRFAMIHNDPTSTSATISTPNARASTLFVLSGPVVIWMKNTR